MRRSVALATFACGLLLASSASFAAQPVKHHHNSGVQLAQADTGTGAPKTHHKKKSHHTHAKKKHNSTANAQ